MRNKYFFTLILLLFSVFWIWWIPGLRVANDFSFISDEWLRLQLDIPRVWNERGAEGLGEYGVFTLWSYPINLIFGILANLGLNFQIWERILVILYIFLGSLSIWKFLSQYTLSNKSKFIGSLFYLINTYPILLIDGGQLSIALAYGLFPLVYFLTLEAVYSARDKKILAGLVISALGFFDIRFLFILFLLLLLRSLFDILEGKNNRFKILWKWISTSLVTGLVVLTLNSFWLIAIVKTPLEKDILSSFTKMSANFLNTGHSILVLSPHWYKNVFGKISQLHPEFILVVILVFLAPILRRKDKNIAFWLFVAVLAIFLAKGEAEPLSFIYPFLHSNIPGFSFFRDSTKFFFLITLSYSILISITSEEILKRLKGRLQSVYILFIIVYILYLIRPVFLGQMTGTFSVQPFEKEFRSLSKVLKNDKNFGRVFWIPATAPLAYSDLNHPVVEAARVFNIPPFVYGVKGTYEIFNFLREASYMSEIFDIAGIGYIAYPYLDLRRDNLHTDNIRYYYTFLKQLSERTWLTGVNSPIPLLKTKQHQDRFFITPNTWWVVGSDNILNEATKSAKLKLSKNALIFTEEYPGLGNRIEEFPDAKIVLNNKTELDLAASFIDLSNIVFPAKNLDFKPNEAGWWKREAADLIDWRNFLREKYGIDNQDFDLGGGWAVGEKSVKLKVKSEKFKKDQVLLARIMESSRSGTLKFYQGNLEIGEVSTKINGDANVRWFEVGSLNSDKEIIIAAEGDINVINALALLNKNEWASLQDKARSLRERIVEFDEKNAYSDTDFEVTYQKINPTKYKVSISNLKQPALLVFSQNYDGFWKLNGQTPLPVYSLLNGFRIEEDGEYIVEFEAQIYVYPGLVVTGITLLVIMTICLSPYLQRLLSGSRK